jgi:hypothetical protein
MQLLSQVLPLVVREMQDAKTCIGKIQHQAPRRMKKGSHEENDAEEDDVATLDPHDEQVVAEAEKRAFFGYKSAGVCVLGNFAHKNPMVQDLLRTTGGLDVLLNRYLTFNDTTLCFISIALSIVLYLYIYRNR